MIFLPVLDLLLGVLPVAPALSSVFVGGEGGFLLSRLVVL